VIVMTDADVDGAHIASAADHLLLPADAEADRQRPSLSRGAPLYRLSHGGKNFYARDEKHRTS